MANGPSFKVMAAEASTQALGVLLLCATASFFVLRTASPWSWYLPLALLGFTFYLCRKVASGPMARVPASLAGKVAIVTGANTGLGKETARMLGVWGCSHVVLACRSVERGQAAEDELRRSTGLDDVFEFRQCDLSDLKSVEKFARSWPRGYEIDFLVLNAGVMMTPYLETAQGIELQFGTNHIGHYLLTNLLLENLSASARVCSVSSMGHVFAPNHIDWMNVGKHKYDPTVNYGISKLANILFIRELTKRLPLPNQRAFVVHPGAVATELSRHFNVVLQLIARALMIFVGKNAYEGAQTTLYALTDRRAPIDGVLIGDNTMRGWEMPSTELSRDDDEAALLWDVSFELI